MRIKHQRMAESRTQQPVTILPVPVLAFGHGSRPPLQDAVAKQARTEARESTTVTQPRKACGRTLAAGNARQPAARNAGKFQSIMWCMKCQKTLAECECPDLKERLERLAKLPYLVIGKDKMDAYEKQADRNKNEKTVQE